MARLASPVLRPAADGAANSQLESQTLWHMRRAGIPDVTAILRLREGRVVMDVAYGAVVRQTRVFTDALVALQWAETLRECLETIGYCRHGRKRSTRKIPGRSATSR